MVSTELGAVAVFTAVVLFVWSPLLVVERLRALFVWPTRWMALNYALLGVGILLVQCLSYLAVFLLAAGIGMVTGGDVAAIVGGVIIVNLAVPSAGAIAALRTLPARGIWSPAGDGLSGRIALGVGVLWYAIVTTVLFLVIGAVILVANLPT
ncbi:hypothetical protein KY092_14770 [Natronomonas gomsonensis]|uniref:hypothetical protein n=1 Tax=Natronomonas gomsonensis TaxID=1046043 RepID=UPI0020CA986B|nr:hypothetical protein [Natronomonas gomsonensis]MCY4731820.1 hypothetical protein [Natronomonas gomsonensis]